MQLDWSRKMCSEAAKAVEDELSWCRNMCTLAGRQVEDRLSCMRMLGPLYRSKGHGSFCLPA